MSVRMRMSVAMSVTVAVTARSMCVRDFAAVVSMPNARYHKQATGTGCDQQRKIRLRPEPSNAVRAQPGRKRG